MTLSTNIKQANEDILHNKIHSNITIKQRQRHTQTQTHRHKHTDTNTQTLTQRYGDTHTDTHKLKVISRSGIQKLGSISTILKWLRKIDPNFCPPGLADDHTIHRTPQGTHTRMMLVSHVICVYVSRVLRIE